MSLHCPHFRQRFRATIRREWGRHPVLLTWARVPTRGGADGTGGAHTYVLRTTGMVDPGGAHTYMLRTAGMVDEQSWCQAALRLRQTETRMWVAGKLGQ